ncbi:MAG: circadian clock protein KaiC, partial [Planctomycetales bacterium]|nr:circadian clock protein KaiC [Planctomycetales bacterium]
RLRVVKYRGTTHGTNEYPFLIDSDGISILPLTSLRLQHEVTQERISSGVPRLDEMLGGKGYYRGSSVLLSGTAGSGKTSLAAHFADAACARGERVLYFAFEESPNQIMRNLASVGFDLRQWVERDLLRFHALRATLHGLEMHLVNFHKLVSQFEPQVVIVDPISSLLAGGGWQDANAVVTRLIDYLKVEGITAMFTNLTDGDATLEKTSLNISSVVDSWLLLRDVELGGERNRVMYILKSRGMAHSNQLREFLLTGQGVQLRDAYLGPEGVLTGSMRLAQEQREQAQELAVRQQAERQRRELERKRAVLEAHIERLRNDFQFEEEETERTLSEIAVRQRANLASQAEMAASRHSSKEFKND